jgi:hypothetical protein
MAKAPVGEPSGQGAAKAPETYWRSFPQLEALLATGSPELLERVEKTCLQLDALARNGSAQEQSRARSALAAYARMLELYKQLAELRNATGPADEPITRQGGNP